jgi:hypothetical protein
VFDVVDNPVKESLDTNYAWLRLHNHGMSENAAHVTRPAAPTLFIGWEFLSLRLPDNRHLAAPISCYASKRLTPPFLCLNLSQFDHDCVAYFGSKFLSSFLLFTLCIGRRNASHFTQAKEQPAPEGWLLSSDALHDLTITSNFLEYLLKILTVFETPAFDHHHAEEVCRSCRLRPRPK